MEYLNAYRMKVRGIKPLVWNEELAVTARAHSEYMGHGGGVTHNPAPDGSDTIRIDFWENVTNVSGGAQGSLEVWAESNGHHNILFVGDEGAVGFSGGYATFRTFDTD
jgi:uncharacterized protein YkwD